MELLWNGSVQIIGCSIIFAEKSSGDLWLQLLFDNQFELLLKSLHVPWHYGILRDKIGLCVWNLRFKTFMLNKCKCILLPDQWVGLII